ncbi:MAG: Ig-like domain-containing protein, partial [Anaerolineae bacterium]
MKRRTSLLMQILLVVVLFLTLSCRSGASPTPAPTTTPRPPTPVPYPPLPAPKLIFSTPAPFEPQALGEPVELVFDQPMDQQSVIRAFDIEPGIGGELAWDDARTLRFTPAAAFDRGASYQVTVGEAAQNAEGEALLEPVAFEFQTVGFVEIAEVQPIPDSEDVDPDTTITIIFSRPVVPLTSVERQNELPVPLTLDPPVTGRGEWLNTTIYRLYPEQGLAPATTYTARIPAGLEDIQGAILAEPYVWTFSTIRPIPTIWSPPSNAQHVGPSEVISITFNQPMDHASTEAAFRLTVNEQPVTGAFRWTGGMTPLDDETLLFTSAQPLPRNTSADVSLAGSARARDSRITLSEDTTWGFWTVRDPAVINTVPPDGRQGVDPLNGVEITFASPMRTAAFLDHLTIIPQPTEVYTYWSESDTMLQLSFPKEPATRYRITLDAAAPDRYGGTLDARLSLAFTTGDLSPYASLNAPGSIGTFDAYTDTVIYARHRNITRLDVALYRLSLDTFMRLHGYSSWDYRSRFRPAAADLVRQWSVYPDAPRNASALRGIAIVDAQGEQLPPGIYYLELSAPEVMARSDDARPEGFTLVRSATNLVLKQALTESLVWATDLASGEPLQGEPVRLYREGKPEGRGGRTDGDGLWLAEGLTDVDQWDDLFVVLGEPGNSAFAVAYNNWDSGISPWDFELNSEYGASRTIGYLYTDRPIYRPGQTVYFKGIVRQDDDADYTIPMAMRTLEVSVSDSQGRDLYRETLPVSDMGSFFDELLLGEEAPLGSYYIQVQDEAAEFFSGTSFRVAEYRKPEFEVTVETDKTAYLHGDAIKVTVQASYYFGGPVADAALTWNALSAPHTFQYQCPEGTSCASYTWWDYDDGEDYGEYFGSYGRLVANGSTTTDAQGRATFRVSADIAEEISSRNFTIEASITDINGQEVSQRTTATVHRGDFYIGTTSERRVAQAGEAQRLGALTVDWNSEPVGGVGLDVVVMERHWLSVREESEGGYIYWTWTTEDVPVYTTTTTTDPTGKAWISFTPEKSGTYRVRASGKDGAGNEVRSSTYLWVWGGGDVVWRRESTNRIDLVADRDLYQIGDVAEILIPSPYSGTVQALITIERGHILKTEVRELQGATEILRIPIVEAFAPNVFVSVILMQGSAQTPERLATFKMGEVMLPVSTETRALQVTLTPDRALQSGETYRPRETATYDIRVTDGAGRPVVAELSLRLADLAVLALADDTGPTLMERFWSQRGLGVRTSTPLAVAMEIYNRELTPGIKGGGGGGEDDLGFVRTRFADTAFWAAVVKTDAEGRARVEVDLPDNLTTWRMQARAITAETLVGQSDVDIQTTLDLLVRPVLPRFFVVGDQAEIATIVHNNTAEAVVADVSIAVEGLSV